MFLPPSIFMFFTTKNTKVIEPKDEEIDWGSTKSRTPVKTKEIDFDKINLVKSISNIKF